MQVKAGDSRGIDWDKFVSVAIASSKNEKVDWQVKNIHTEGHPVQAVRPEERILFASNDNEIDYWED